jgi:2-desacetyl-2-hydroxyethyl bacteriochlorophyllide A dehydrogenase
MKCIVCERPDQLIMKETSIPTIQEGEVLVRVRRIGICGTDLHAYKGRQPYFTYPRVLGHELSGVIEEIGDNEYGLLLGDQVSIIPYIECGKCIACRQGKTNCCIDMSVLGVHEDGGMREYLPVPIDHLIKTNEISLEQSAIVEPLSIGAHAVGRSEVKKNEFALVIGAGPIGLGVMKFAKLAGAKVIAMDINEERLHFCGDWVPADFTVNALQDPIRQIEAITNGDYPSVVFDATGNKESMVSAFQYVAHGGKLVYVGLVKEDITFNDPDFHKKELTLLSSRNATRHDFEYVIRSIKDEKIDTASFITHRTFFDEMIGTYESWLRPETGVIKALVEL